MDVDQEADRTDPDGPVQEEPVQEERRRGDQLRPVEEIVHLTEGLRHLGKDKLLEQELQQKEAHQLQEELAHLTEELLYLNKELQLDQHLREQLMPLEVKHLQVKDKLQEQLDKLVLQELTQG